MCLVVVCMEDGISQILSHSYSYTYGSCISNRHSYTVICNHNVKKFTGPNLAWQISKVISFLEECKYIIMISTVAITKNEFL